MVRYRFWFTDNEGTEYSGEISNAGYTGATVTLEGSAVIRRDTGNNVYQPLQVKACDITLHATEEHQLEDIYNEVDRYWLFHLKKNGTGIFQGYVSTEDMQQPFNAYIFDLSFEALGHLHYLENIGYYDNAQQPFEGRSSLLTIMKRCLDKGFNAIDGVFGVLTAHHLTNSGADLFETLYLDQSQFYDEDGEAKDCKTILQDILKSLGCFVFQYRLNFVIISVKNWVNMIARPISYRKYTSDGNFQISLSFENFGPQQVIGNDIGNSPTYHINENQTITNKKLYNAFRVQHKFDYAEQVLRNGELIASSGLMPDWVLGTDAAVVGDSIEIAGRQLVSQITLAATSSAVALRQDDVMIIEISAGYQDNPTEQEYEVLLQDTDSGTVYSYRTYQSGEDSEDFSLNNWVALPVGSQVETRLRFSPSEQEYVHTVKMAPLPENGNLLFKAYTGIFGNDYNASTSKTILRSVIIKAEEKPIESEIFTAARTDLTIGQVPKVYEVPFNTVERNILNNTFVDAQGVAIASLDDHGRSMSSAEHIAREFITFFSDTNKVFSGDVYNYEDFGPKFIVGAIPLCLVSNESCDLKRNTATLTIQQLYLDEPPYEMSVKRVFKNVSKPTIKT